MVATNGFAVRPAGTMLCLVLALATGAVSAAPEDAKINLSALSADESNQRFIVRFDESTRGNSSRVRTSVNEVARGVGVGLQLKRQMATGSYLVEADSRLPEQASAALMRAFARRAEVTYVEPDVVMQAHFEPNDQYYPQQWHYHEALAGLNLPDAWAQSATGMGVVVAVLDTGQTNHADLNGQFVAGYDFVTNGGNIDSRDGNDRDADPNDEGDWNAAGECGIFSPASDSSWHGTHVAGTVAAATDNDIGVAGVAFDAKIQHVRVLGKCGGFLSDISDAIIWAAGGSVSGVPGNATRAKVINLSLGGGGSCGAEMQSAVNSAVGNGATVVVSAGNSNANAANYQPASCANVITVAATDRGGNRSYYSNYGDSVEIAAPGGDMRSNGVNGVASTLNTGATVQAGDTYVYYQGTSMAAPHISGLAAMLYEIDPDITPAAVMQAITSTARPLAGTCTGGCGAGLANAAAAVAAVAGNDPPPVTEPETPATPTNFSASAETSGKRKNRTVNSISVTWNYSGPEVTGFLLERCKEQGRGKNKTCPYATVGTGLQSDPSARSWSDPALELGVRYRIRALNGNLESGTVVSNKL